MKKILLLLTVPIALVACVPATTIKTFVDPSLSKNSLSSGGVTILPLLLSSKVKDANIPELRRELSRKTGESVRSTFPSAKIVSADQTLDIISKNDLLDSFTSTSVTFDATGSLRPDTLNKITDKTGTRYVLLPYLQNANTETTTSGIYNTRSITHYATFSFVIWDKQQQKSVYEGSGTQENRQGLLINNKNLIDTTYAAFDKVGAKLIADIK